MQAEAVVEAITITVAQMVDGELILETDCLNYDHYNMLPAAVSFAWKGEQIICGKTGWSSDRNYACYKSSKPIAFRV